MFVSLGFQGTTMRLIAAELGIKAASIYHHFSCKEDLLFAYLHESIESFNSTCRSAYFAAGSDPADRLAAIVKANTLWQLERLDTTPFLNVNIYGVSHLTQGLPETRREILRSKQNEFLSMLREAVKSGNEAGRFDVRDDLVTSYAIIGLIDHSVYWFRKEGRLSAEQVADDFAELALRLVGTRP